MDHRRRREAFSFTGKIRIAVFFTALITAVQANSQDFIPEVGKTSKVCLQSHIGTFVCAESGGGREVVVNRAVAREWETFEMTRVTEDRVTFKTFESNYLCAEGGGGHLVVADRTKADQWETFEIYVGGDGLISLRTLPQANGKSYWVCAEPTGVLVANREKVGPYEKFLLCAPSHADLVENTQIVVNVYKIGGAAPLWHSGTVIDGREYFFHTSNTVKSIDVTKEKMGGMTHHRTIVRYVPGSLKQVKGVLAAVTKSFDGKRYDLAERNCNSFTNALLQALGTTSLDREYRENSGLGKALRGVPGGALAQEVLVKWPVTDKRLDDAAMDDLGRLYRLPEDIHRELSSYLEARIGTGLPFAPDGKGPANEAVGRATAAFKKIMYGKK